MKALIFLVPLLLVACAPDGEDTLSYNPEFQLVAVGGETCVFDANSTLLWEQKSTEPGLRHFENTYSWFHPNEAHGELDYRGTEDAGDCTASACDVWSFVLAVNETGLCGYNDWRMPTKDELYSISDVRKAASPPTTDTSVFPHTQSAEYWSGNDYSFRHDAAWGWSFELGHDRVDWKKQPKYVRLVRGNAATLQAVKE
ncbi:MAG: DUF1566 domain-containing protein [Gammaproteobacteria bacterium]|nr:DUF1566 domain-containing protein [Gammaproteobacteria bacterium]